MTTGIRRLAGAMLLAGTGGLAATGAPAPDQVRADAAGAVAASLTGAPGDAARGAEIYARRDLGNCVACHQVAALPEVPFQGNVGPALDGVAGRWSEAGLRGIVVDAKQVFPGTIMPAFYKSTGYVRPGDGFTGQAATEPLAPLLSADEVEDVLAFLMTLEPE